MNTLPVALIDLGKYADEIILWVLKTWNEVLGATVDLITRSPLTVFSGTGNDLSVSVFDATLFIGHQLAIVFFLVGAIQGIGRLAELKRPEVAGKLILRLLMTDAFISGAMAFTRWALGLVGGLISTVTNAGGSSINILSGSSGAGGVDLFQYTQFQEKIKGIDKLYEGVGVVFLIMFILVLMGILFMFLYTVMGRFLRIWLYVCVMPLSCSTLAGEPTGYIGKAYLKNFLAVLLEGIVIILAVMLSYSLAPAVAGLLPLLTLAPDTSGFVALMQFSFRSVIVAGIMIAAVKGAEHLSQALFGGH